MYPNLTERTKTQPKHTQIIVNLNDDDKNKSQPDPNQIISKKEKLEPI